MGATKAPGPDGLPPIFFQRFWPVIGPAVTNFILQVFTSGALPTDLNESIICLIPKVVAPESLHQCRPISLCNVLVKAISKVLANRLKPIMDKLTGPEQSSFIPGRSTTDNILIAQEVLHSLRKRKGCSAGFVLKVDLEKAYDRIEWSFLREVLRFSGFNDGFQRLIMTLVSSTVLAVCWNGDTLQPFTPTQGLRQGDPLSPYLFVLCMEVLGQSISAAVASGVWKSVCTAPRGPGISHLFFVGDLILCGEASFSQAKTMEHLLASFCGLSDQRVSRPKSRIWFSLNNPRYLQTVSFRRWLWDHTWECPCYTGG